MLRSSLGYPTRPPHGGRVVLLSGLLVVLAWVFVGISTIEVALYPLAFIGLILWLVVRGYYVHVLRTTIGRARPTPPPFGGYGRLLVDGIKSLLIVSVYFAPGILVFAGIVGVMGLEIDGVPGPILGTGAGMLALAGMSYLAGALFIVPIAVARFAYTDRLGAAFEVRTNVEAAFSEDYAVAWIVAAGIQAIFVPLAYLLYPLVVGVFLRVYLSISVRYLYGGGVGAALELDPVATPENVSRHDQSARSALDRIPDEDAPDLRPAIRPIDDDGFDSESGSDGSDEDDRNPPT